MKRREVVTPEYFYRPELPTGYESAVSADGKRVTLIPREEPWGFLNYALGVVLASCMGGIISWWVIGSI